MTTGQHTKTPWYSNGRDIQVMAHGPDGPETVAIPAASNRKQELAIRDSIIRDHNSHDALVEALLAIVGAVSSEHWDKPSYMMPFIKGAESAIALAERS